MLTTLHCFALHTVRYSDRSNIVAVYTLEQGRVSLSVSAGASRESRRKRALMMPMSFLECVADVRPDREILPVKDVRQGIALATVHADPIKMTVAMFLAEFLGMVLREYQHDARLYGFVESAMRILDDTEGMALANFPITFLYRFSRFAGIEPDISTYSPGAVFDMLDGTFRMTPPLHRRYVDSAGAAVLHGLSRMTWANMHRYRFNRHDRRSVIEKAIEYYSIRYPALTALKSLDVLGELYD